jgi:hypothetical protein
MSGGFSGSIEVVLMSVLIECPSCLRKLRLSENILGRQIKCPACNHGFTAATAPEEISPAPPPLEEQPIPLPPGGSAGETGGGPYLPPPRTEPSVLIDYLVFRRMITPLIIQFLFWISVILCVFGGLAQVVLGLFSPRYVNFAQVLLGLLTILLGPILVRIYCEMIILFFRMNETLTEIKDNTTPPPP